MNEVEQETEMRSASGMSWGVKTSFLEYIFRAGDFKQSLTEGVSVTSSRDQYHFELADVFDFDYRLKVGTLKFRGDLRLSAHSGMLFIQIKDPWITFYDSNVLMTIVNPNQSNSGEERIPLAEWTAPQAFESMGWLTWDNVPARLAHQAVPLFNSVYEAGMPFDPVQIRLATLIASESEG